MSRLLEMVREGKIVQRERLFVAYWVATGRTDAVGMLRWQRALGLTPSAPAQVDHADA